MTKQIRILLELTKFRISAFASFSTFAGFILAKQELSKEFILPTLGVFFLASGCCALNQYQERRIDGLMERTRERPLPSGKLNACTALSIASGLISLGSLILLCVNWVVLGLGLFAAVWYNGVYTYLKRRTAFAVIPGALIGAVPPALGWASGGDSLLDPRIGAVALFFFIWQVPHFWLHLKDFSEDYEKAGLPSLTGIFSAQQMKGILFIWILSTALSGLLIPLFRFVNFYFIYFFLLALTLWLVWNAITFFSSLSKEASFRLIFRKLNIYALLLLSSLAFDKLL